MPWPLLETLELLSADTEGLLPCLRARPDQQPAQKTVCRLADPAWVTQLFHGNSLQDGFAGQWSIVSIAKQFVLASGCASAFC